MTRPLVALLPGAALLFSSCHPSATGSTERGLRATTRVVYYHPTIGAGPSLLTREDGSVLDERRSEPFGAAIDSRQELPGGGTQTGPVDYARDPHNALNKETDAATGWSDHGARWLAPESARWLTPDPPVKAPDPAFMSEPWALHPYQYVNQNPVLFWDPDGRDKVRSEPGTYVISFRRYVASATFGGGFVGDNRGPSADPNARHRTSLNIAFNPVTQTIPKGGVTGTSSGIEAVGSFARFLSSERDQHSGTCLPAYGYKSMPPVSASADVVGRRGDRTFIQGASAASDNLIWFPFPPNLDTSVFFAATMQAGRLVVVGEASGDPYTSLDVVISDAAGNTVLLGGSQSNGYLGISMLGASSANKLATFEASIDVSSSGIFTGNSSVNYTDENAVNARMDAEALGSVRWSFTQ